MEAAEKAREILARHRNYQSSNPKFQQMLDDCFVFAFVRGATWAEEIHCDKIGEQIMKPIKAKQLLSILQEAVDQHGDIDVYCDSYTLIDAGYTPEDNSIDMITTGSLRYTDEETYKQIEQQ